MSSTNTADIFDNIRSAYEASREDEMTMADYLELCKASKDAYSSPAERMLKAIGEPKDVDTRNDPRLSRIFSNRVIQIYPAFADFYGMEDTIMDIVSHFKHAAQGLEEKKQALYLLGPVGGGKSSLAEKLKDLIQSEPFYAIKGSPVNDNPLALLTADPRTREQNIKLLQDVYGIDKRYLGSILSPWAAKRFKEARGDLSQFTVVKRYPSIMHQIAVTKTEPGDENNQDISALVGKVDIRKLEKFEQNDPDAYSYSGGLNLGNRGMLEFVEMFKAPIKVLHPLLTATQEGNYKGTEGFGAIPFDGIILAHSNESEWETFKNNKNNEAFLDRINTIKVPYCLRVSDEVKIYQKLLNSSSLSTAPCAPGTLDMLARLAVYSRLEEPENSSTVSKMKVYDGENLKNTDPKAKSYQEYKDFASKQEGMSGLSTRWAYKILSKTFNFDRREIAADPIHLMSVLEKSIENEQFPEKTEKKYLEFIKGTLAPEYNKFIGKQIQTAYLESYSDYGQNMFDRYITYADFWIQDNDFRDEHTGQMLDRTALNSELEKLERPAGISNPKDFRNEVVNFVLRYRSTHEGKNPSWTSYEKLREVIEKKMFANTEDMLPIISFNAKRDTDEQKKHDNFVSRMTEKGYTPSQTRRIVDWHLRANKVA